MGEPALHNRPPVDSRAGPMTTEGVQKLWAPQRRSFPYPVNSDFSDGADPVRLPKFRHRSAAPKVGALTIQGIFAFGPPNENLSPDC